MKTTLKTMNMKKVFEEIPDPRRNITGYITGIKRQIHRNHEILSFVINNNCGQDRVQIIVWNEQINRIEPYVQLHNIVKIQDARVTNFTLQKYNCGTVDFKLTIDQNTTVLPVGTLSFEELRH